MLSTSHTHADHDVQYVTHKQTDDGHQPDHHPPHPLVTAFRTTRLVYHQQCVRLHPRWSTFVWLRLLRQFAQSALPVMQPNYRLVAIPPQFYARLTADQFLQSDHYVIVPHSTHGQLIAQPDEYWRQLVFVSPDAQSVRVVDSTTVAQACLKKPNASVLVGVLAAAPDTPMEPNALYVSESCYENCVAKFKLDTRRSCDADISVQLQPMQQPGQRAPQLATRATIFTINQPHELPVELLDEILGEHFKRPRILYRNTTYEIPMDAQQLGTAVWARHMRLCQQLRSLFVRCVHLESADNSFELCAVVMKSRTTLQQSSSVHMPLPRRRLHAWCSGLTPYPAGLDRYFNALSSSVQPFIGQMGSAAPTPESTDEAPAPANGLTALPLILLQGPRGAGKTTILYAVAAALGLPVLLVDCADLVSQIAAQQETKLRHALAGAKQCKPLLLALANFELFGVDAEGREDQRAVHALELQLGAFFAEADRRLPVVLVAISNETETRPLLRRLFVDAIAIGALDKEQRAHTLGWLHRVDRMCTAAMAQRHGELPLCGRQSGAEYTARFGADLDAVLLDVAERTPGFLYGDVRLLYGNTVNRMRALGQTQMTAELFEHNLARMQAQFADSLGAPKVPAVLWSDIGGLAKLKEEIQTSIGLPLTHMHLMGRNLRRSGILLYGPPGTGKTLVAKAVATECNLSFLSVQGPELLNMYVGQSEQNVREVFARAREAAPCVVFLDELDALAPNRGMAGDSGGVMDRVVSQLMTEMNGMADGEWHGFYL